MGYVSGHLHVEKYDPRVRVRILVVSAPWVLLNLAAIVTDLGLGFSIPEEDALCWSCHPGRSLSIMVVVLIYWTDIALRVYSFRPRVFFRKMWNVFDAAVVFISTVAVIVEICGFSSRRTKGVAVLRIVR